MSEEQCEEIIEALRELYSDKYCLPNFSPRDKSLINWAHLAGIISDKEFNKLKFYIDFQPCPVTRA